MHCDSAWKERDKAVSKEDIHFCVVFQHGKDWLLESKTPVLWMYGKKNCGVFIIKSKIA